MAWSTVRDYTLFCFFAKYQYFLIKSINYIFGKNKFLCGAFSYWFFDRGVQFILWKPLTLKMRTHHFSFHPSPFLLDGVTSKPFDGVHSFGKSPKHFPFNQKNYWIGTLPQNRPHTCGVIIHKAAATMAASVATKLSLIKSCEGTLYKTQSDIYALSM